MAPPGRKQKVAGRVTTAAGQPSRKGVNNIDGRVQQQQQKQQPQCPESTAPLPVELQQMILDVFRRAFLLDQAHDLKAIIQEVKGHLFLRNFDSAFAKPEYLDAYALRWSASRALGYSEILLHDDLRRKIWPSSDDSGPGPNGASQDASASRVACIGGGGGAEVAACAAAAKTLSLPIKLEVHAIDIADWSTCLTKLEGALCTPAQLSQYASESAKAANKPFIEGDQFAVRFSRHDVLAAAASDDGQLGDLVRGVGLCTIMFTLNELFASSISRATAFLLALTDAMDPGSWLLVVDSPGSYSEVKMNQGDSSKTRQYPMKWLLEHALLEVAGKKGQSNDNNRKWKRHVSDDSRWFRLNPALKYPIELENMRYQIHLYQRVRLGEAEDDSVEDPSDLRKSN